MEDKIIYKSFLNLKKQIQLLVKSWTASKFNQIMFQSWNFFAIDNVLLFVYIHLLVFPIASFEDVNLNKQFGQTVKFTLFLLG